MRPFISLSCSREADRLKGGAPASCSRHVDHMGRMRKSEPGLIIWREYDGHRRLDVSFESRLRRPSGSSFCSREDHRLARTRQVRAWIRAARRGCAVLFQPFLRGRGLLLTRVRSLRLLDIFDQLASATSPVCSRTRSKLETTPTLPFFSSLGWTIMEPPETRLTTANRRLVLLLDELDYLPIDKRGAD